MRELHVIMPMAGEGLRFVKEGWGIPKPLISINGKRLFQYALESIEDDICTKYSFIVRQEHIKKYELNKIITSTIAEANIFSVDKTTRGAVETCLMSKEAIGKEDAILILDCDLRFKSRSFFEHIRSILQLSHEEVDGGLLLSFESNDKRYSYAKINDDNIVLRTAEKEVISNHALCGAYFFSRSESFLYAANSLMKSKELQKECYVSLLYNILLERGETVKLINTEEYQSFGTPEELKSIYNLL